MIGNTARVQTPTMIGMPEGGQNEAGNPHEAVADVEQRDEQVDAGDETREDPPLPPRRDGADGLDHAARPPGPLAHEVRDLGRRIGERDRRRFGQHGIAGLHEAPRHDDVLADRVGPSADPSQLVGPVERERALRDQGRLVETLHALHRRDTEEVVPLLHTRQQVGARVADHHGAGDGNGVGRRALESGATRRRSAWRWSSVSASTVTTYGVSTRRSAWFSAFAFPGFGS